MKTNKKKQVDLSKLSSDRISGPLKESIASGEIPEQFTIEHVTEVTGVPFAALVKEFKPALRQKQHWYSALKEIETELYEIYSNKNLVETFISIYLDHIEEVTGGRLLHEYKNKHFTKVVDRAISKLLERLDNDNSSLQVGVVK